MAKSSAVDGLLQRSQAEQGTRTSALEYEGTFKTKYAGTRQ